MKKIMSASGFGVLAIALLMSSCVVSKKKYVQAQQHGQYVKLRKTHIAQYEAV